MVRFEPAPADRGTEVHVTITLRRCRAAQLGEALASYFGEDPHQQLDDDLRRFKQVMETGEVVRSDGAPWGKRARAASSRSTRRSRWRPDARAARR